MKYVNFKKYMFENANTNANAEFETNVCLFVFSYL